MAISLAGSGEQRGEDYHGWQLRQRLELLAFDARLAGVPQVLLKALWKAIDQTRTADRHQVRDQPSAPVYLRGESNRACHLARITSDSSIRRSAQAISSRAWAQIMALRR